MWLNINEKLINLDNVISIGLWSENNRAEIVIRYADTTHQPWGFIACNFDTIEKRDEVFTTIKDRLRFSKFILEVE